MNIHYKPHQSYLLRLRHVDNAGQPRWVITLEEPGGQAWRLDDLQALLRLLEEKMESPTLALPREGTMKG